MGCCCCGGVGGGIGGGGGGSGGGGDGVCAIEFSEVATNAVVKPLLGEQMGETYSDGEETIVLGAGSLGNVWGGCAGAGAGAGGAPSADDLSAAEFHSCVSKHFRDSFSLAAREDDDASSPSAQPSPAPLSAPVTIEPLVPRAPGAPPVWLSKRREVFRVRFGGACCDVPRNYVFGFSGAAVTLEVDGYHIPGSAAFAQLRAMALGREGAPHAPWRAAHGDDAAGIRAWTRPPPELPWLAPPETMRDRSKMHQVRVEALFQCPAQVLYDVLHDSSYRKVWDDRMLKGERVVELTARADIGYYAAALPPPLSNRDFCNLRTWRELSESEFVIMNYSVQHEACREDAYVRAVSYGSGYLVRAVTAETCMLHSVSHTDMRTSVPAWIINGKIASISCGSIPKLREAAANYRLYQRLKSLPAVPAWRTEVYPADKEERAAAALREAEREARQDVEEACAAAWSGLVLLGGGHCLRQGGSGAAADLLAD